MFCFIVSVIIEEFVKYVLDLLYVCEWSVDFGGEVILSGCCLFELSVEQFKYVLDILIDYVVMEKFDCVVVVFSNMGWSDIGLWYFISELILFDLQGNCIYGDVLLYEVSNCYIKSDDCVVGVVGVENLIIVDILDVFFVVNCDNIQDVKYIVGQLKKVGYESY